MTRKRSRGGWKPLVTSENITWIVGLGTSQMHQAQASYLIRSFLSYGCGRLRLYWDNFIPSQFKDLKNVEHHSIPRHRLIDKYSPYGKAQLGTAIDIPDGPISILDPDVIFYRKFKPLHIPEDTVMGLVRAPGTCIPGRPFKVKDDEAWDRLMGEFGIDAMVGDTLFNGHYRYINTGIFFTTGETLRRFGPEWEKYTRLLVNDFHKFEEYVIPWPREQVAFGLAMYHHRIDVDTIPIDYHLMNHRAFLNYCGEPYLIHYAWNRTFREEDAINPRGWIRKHPYATLNIPTDKFLHKFFHKQAAKYNWETDGKLYREQFSSRKIQQYDRFEFQENQIVHAILQRKPKRVLEVCCGFGRILELIQDHVEDLHGADLSPTMLDQCPEDLKAKLTVANATRLPYPDKSFDIVYTCEGFLHIPPEHIDKARDELIRVGRTVIMMEQRHKGLSDKVRIYHGCWNHRHENYYPFDVTTYYDECPDLQQALYVLEQED